MSHIEKPFLRKELQHYDCTKNEEVLNEKLHFLYSIIPIKYDKNELFNILTGFCVTYHYLLFFKSSVWSHLLHKTLMENFIFCAVKEEKDIEVARSIL